MHLGVILPNYGAGSSPDRIHRVAETAEELGFDSIWATEHIVVGPEGVDPYGRVYAPLVTLAWIAGWTDSIGLGTSIVLVPLHNPFHLAKEVATLQELSGGRFTLGVGVGWHRDEYDEDWSRLWWIRLRGRARVLDGGAERLRALELLREKYPQYRGEALDGPVLAVDVTDLREWEASPDRAT